MKNSLHIPTIFLIAVFFSFSACTVERSGDDANASRTVDASTSFAYVTNGVASFWVIAETMMATPRLKRMPQPAEWMVSGQRPQAVMPSC